MAKIEQLQHRSEEEKRNERAEIWQRLPLRLGHHLLAWLKDFPLLILDFGRFIGKRDQHSFDCLTRRTWNVIVARPVEVIIALANPAIGEITYEEVYLKVDYQFYLMQKEKDAINLVEELAGESGQFTPDTLQRIVDEDIDTDSFWKAVEFLFKSHPELQSFQFQIDNESYDIPKDDIDRLLKREKKPDLHVLFESKGIALIAALGESSLSEEAANTIVEEIEDSSLREILTILYTDKSLDLLSIDDLVELLPLSHRLSIPRFERKLLNHIKAKLPQWGYFDAVRITEAVVLHGIKIPSDLQETINAYFNKIFSYLVDHPDDFSKRVDEVKAKQILITELRFSHSSISKEQAKEIYSLHGLREIYFSQCEKTNQIKEELDKEQKRDVTITIN